MGPLLFAYSQHIHCLHRGSQMHFWKGVSTIKSSNVNKTKITLASSPQLSSFTTVPTCNQHTTSWFLRRQFILTVNIITILLTITTIFVRGVFLLVSRSWFLRFGLRETGLPNHSINIYWRRPVSFNSSARRLLLETNKKHPVQHNHNH